MSIIQLRRATAALALGLLTLSASGTASALSFCDINGPGALFCEDFEGYTSFSGNSNNGIPLVSEGALETWYGGRFEPWGGGQIIDDVVVRQVGGAQYARFEDEAGIILKIDTTGYISIDLEFDWFLHEVSSSDRLVAGWYSGPIDFVTDPFDSSQNDDMVRNFWDNGPSWAGSWTEIHRANVSSWTTSAYTPPTGQSELYVAFWLDDGEGDKGKLDNVIITGEVIPEPGTFSLVALGLAGFAAMRRR